MPGNVTNESIVLNEDSLWSGNTNSTGGYAEGPTGTFGSYQLFGNLLINLPCAIGLHWLQADAGPQHGRGDGELHQQRHGL